MWEHVRPSAQLPISSSNPCSKVKEKIRCRTDPCSHSPTNQTRAHTLEIFTGRDEERIQAHRSLRSRGAGKPSRRRPRTAEPAAHSKTRTGQKLGPWTPNRAAGPPPRTHNSTIHSPSSSSLQFWSVRMRTSLRRPWVQGVPQRSSPRTTRGTTRLPEGAMSAAGSPLLWSDGPTSSRQRPLPAWRAAPLMRTAARPGAQAYENSVRVTRPGYPRTAAKGKRRDEP